MKYVISGLLFLVTGCTTFNATVDGAQGVVNKTVEAVGDGVADVTSAVGKDITDTITYTTDGTADGIRKITSQDK